MKGPRDSISTEKGNGYNICGPLDYAIEFEDFTNNVNIFSFRVEENVGLADDIVLVLNSASSGREIRQAFTLTIKLAEYPLALPIEIQNEIVFRECEPGDNFRQIRIGE